MTSATRIVAGVVVLAVVAAAPQVLDAHQVHILIQIMLFAYLSSCWNILGGFTGQLSFGHAIFLAAGAFTSTLLLLNANVSPWLGMIAGGLVAVMLGLFIGFLSFRYAIKGPYFVLVTLAFAEIARILVLNTPALGGALGMYIPIQENDFWQLKLIDKGQYFYVVLAFLVVALLVSTWIERSAFGHRLLAIRENEDAAQALGIDILRYKLLATALSAFMTALGGTLYAHYVTFIDAHTLLNINMSVEITIYSIVGGLGTVWGPLLGAVVLVPMADVIRATYGQTYAGLHLVVYGIVLILVIRFAPGGFAGLLHLASTTLRRRFGAKRTVAGEEGAL